MTVFCGLQKKAQRGAYVTLLSSFSFWLNRNIKNYLWKYKSEFLCEACMTKVDYDETVVKSRRHLILPI